MHELRKRVVDLIVAHGDNDGIRVGSKTARRYACDVSEFAPNGMYRHGPMWIHFPQSYSAPDGGTVLYQLRIVEEGRRPIAAANCRIPKTERALAAMSRRLKGAIRMRPELAHTIVSGGEPLEPLTHGEPSRPRDNSPVLTPRMALRLPPRISR